MQDSDKSNQQDLLWLSIIGRGGREAEQAMKSLYFKYAPLLKRFMLRRGAGVRDAEDLVQESFVRVGKAAAGFRGDALVSSWLHEIAKNLHVSLARRNRPEDTLDDEGWRTLESANDESDDSGRRAMAEMRGEAARGAASIDMQNCYRLAYAQFRKSFPDAADAMQAIVDEALAIRELASRLKRTEGATREFLSQCRKKFKPFLEPCRRFLSEV